MKRLFDGTGFYVEVLSGGKAVKAPLALSREKSEYSASVGGAEFRLKILLKEEGEDFTVAFDAEADLNGSASGYAFGAEIATGFPFQETKLFAPSCWYGSADNSKFPFLEESAGGGVDSLSAPLAGAYCGGRGVVLTDLTEGRRETAEGDCDAKEEKILVSGKFNFPAVGVRKKENGISLFYTFPAVTCATCAGNKTIRRYLSAKRCRFSFRVWRAESSSFEAFEKSVWRGIYDELAETDETIDVVSAVDAVIRRVENSYGEFNEIPQFMTNCDHFVPESGFLYRNADLASLLLRMKRAGFVVRIPDEKLIRVIDVQVKKEYAGKNQFFAFWRSRFEGVLSVYEAYRLLKGEGKKQSEWLDFVLREAEEAVKADEFFSVPLLTELYRDTGDEKYLTAAKNKCDKVWEENFSKGRFYGGIVDFIGDPSLDKESGIAGMDAYLSLYRITGDKENLVRAARCADYTETYHQLQDINPEPDSFDDTKFHAGGKGNSHVSTRGLGFIGNTCAAGDIAGLLAAGDYCELGKLLGDSHYSDFAVLMFRNAFLTVNLDDKAGAMADALYSSGAGFMNEYIQMGISCDPVGLGRGMMHESDIAWCPYTLLKAAYALKLAGADFTGYAKKRYQEIAVINVREGEEPLFDGNFSTLFDAEGKEIAISFQGEQTPDKVVIAFANADEKCAFRIRCLSKGETAGEREFVHERGFYEVCPLGVCADGMRIEFSEEKHVLLRQIQFFGVTENGLIARGRAKGVSSLGLCLGGKMSFYADGCPIGFDNATNSYLTEGVEFLRKGVLRVNRKSAACEFELPKGKGIFTFAPELNERCEGSVRVEIVRQDKTVFEADIAKHSAVYEGETGGQMQIVFSSESQNSVRFGFYAE